MTATAKANLAKAARVILVFLLVFWGSFRAEAVAYAALTEVKGVGVADVADDERISNLSVYEVAQEPAADNKTGLGRKLASASDDGEVVVSLTLAELGDARDIVAIPAWKGKGESKDEATGKVEIANFVEWNIKGGGVTLEENAKNPGIATLKALEPNAVVTVTCGLTKEAKNKLDLTKFPVDADGNPEIAAFKVDVDEPVVEESRSVSELKVTDEDGELVTGTEKVLVLPKSQVGKAYAFGVEIKVQVLLGDEKTFETYDTLAEAAEAGVEVTWSLVSGDDVAEISQDGELVFSEAGTAEVHVEAAIDGAMTPADFTVKIEGAAPPTDPDDPTAGDDDPDDPEPDPVLVVQGESNPQSTLTVVSNGLVSKPAGDGEGEDEGAGADEEAGVRIDEPSSSSSSSSTSGDSDPDSADEPDGSEGAEEQLERIEKTYTEGDLEALGVGRATYTMYDGSGFVTVTGEGPYLVGLLRDLGIENTDQIESLSFGNADGQSTTVDWAELESASVYYPHAYEGNYEDTSSVSPIIALRSLVRGYGDGTGEGADAARGQDDEPGSGEPGTGGEPDDGPDGGDEPEGAEDDAPGASGSSSSSSPLDDGQPTEPSGSSSSSSSSRPSGVSTSAVDEPAPEVTSDAGIELLDNTRFRLLFGSTSPARAIADPDALRYIDTITVNLKPSAEEPDDPGYDTDIDVSVEYIPVPIGAPAVFSALPNTAIRDARFDFNWEVSTDNGKTWKEVENGNVQVLRVITTDDRIGNKYRVVMSTDAADKNGRENVTVTSEPVTMQEGNGLAVVLEYDPPIAGQTAYFQTTLYGAEKGVRIKYTWQQSQDGGVTWTDIAGRTGSSLAVPTEPIDPNAEKADDAEPVPITYVRVIAEETSGEKRVAISEAVPLTVHVGDDKGDPTDPITPGVDPDDPVDPEDPDEPDTPQPAPTKPTKPRQRVTPIDDIQVEFPEAPTAPDPTGTLTEQVDPTQLYINDAVTETVNEQQEAVEEYIEANVPGARWTSLSTPQATDDDVRNILADNPFAPFVFPVSLGVTCAGGLEKFLAFRRQLDPDAASVLPEPPIKLKR